SHRLVFLVVDAALPAGGRILGPDDRQSGFDLIKKGEQTHGLDYLLC
ncbi:MAG: hypothetical protein RLZZ50_818, partial [Verrucomicrobiota bacterium]